MSALDDALIPRDELRRYLPFNWPGLDKALKQLGIRDRISELVLRKLLASAADALARDDRDAHRAALLELLDGAVIRRADHDRRVADLVAANNRLLDRARNGRKYSEAERERAAQVIRARYDPDNTFAKRVEAVKPLELVDLVAHALGLERA